MATRRTWVRAAVYGALVLALVFAATRRAPIWSGVVQKLSGQRTVAEVVESYGPDARERLRPHFEAAGVAYPPGEVTLLAVKEERRLELWANEPPVYIREYDVLGASGGPGPKLRQGDLQVPEGVYRIVGLNPNSAFHLSMKVDYPNAFDRLHAEIEGRDEPGTDIFIHGKSQSIGCLAMGDDAIEELFVLAADLGIENITVVIAPHDPRERPLAPGEGMPAWTAELYATIEAAFALYERPKP